MHHNFLDFFATWVGVGNELWGKSAAPTHCLEYTSIGLLAILTILYTNITARLFSKLNNIILLCFFIRKTLLEVWGIVSQLVSVLFSWVPLSRIPGFKSWMGPPTVETLRRNRWSHCKIPEIPHYISKKIQVSILRSTEQ